MPVYWDCHVGDENQSNWVQLEGIWQPKPRAWPQPVLLGSEHQMLDGTLDAQRFGYRRTIDISLPRTTTAIKNALEAKFYRFSGGQQLRVTVKIWDDAGSPISYLCDWAESPTWEVLDDKTWRINNADNGERWRVEMKFLIASQL